MNWQWKLELGRNDMAMKYPAGRNEELHWDSMKHPQARNEKLHWDSMKYPVGYMKHSQARNEKLHWDNMKYPAGCNHGNDYYSSHTVSYIGCTGWEYNFSVILPFGLGGSLCILGTAYTGRNEKLHWDNMKYLVGYMKYPAGRNEKSHWGSMK